MCQFCESCLHSRKTDKLVEFCQTLIYGNLLRFFVWDILKHSSMEEIVCPLILRYRHYTIVDIGLCFSHFLHCLSGITKFIILHSNHAAEHIECFHTHSIVCQLEIISSLCSSPFIDFQQFVSCIVVDMDSMRETASKTRIGVHECFHFFWIACTDDDKLASFILHAGHKSLYSLLSFARCASSGFIHRFEVVSFVEEQHTAHCFVDSLVHDFVALINIFRDDVFRHFLRHTVGTRHAQCLEYLSEGACHGTLTCTRITGKDKIELCESLAGLAHLYELLLHSHFVGYAADCILHTVHTYETVQLLHYLLYRNALGSILAYYVGIGKNAIFCIATTINFYCRVEEVAYCTGVSKGFGTFEVHLFEYLRQHLIRLCVEGEYGVFIIIHKHHTEKLF